MGAQFWSVYVPAETLATRQVAHEVLEQTDLVHRYRYTFELALSTDDIVRIRKSGRIASLIGMERGHAIENLISLLRMFYELGARYMTLTHSAPLGAKPTWPPTR